MVRWGYFGRDSVYRGDHFVVADGEADSLSVHHELPPGLLALADQTVVVLPLLGSQLHTLHLLPP